MEQNLRDNIKVILNKKNFTVEDDGSIWFNERKRDLNLLHDFLLVTKSLGAGLGIKIESHLFKLTQTISGSSFEKLAQTVESLSAGPTMSSTKK
jgi:hypothetical protein